MQKNLPGTPQVHCVLADTMDAASHGASDTANPESPVANQRGID
jgi:hypothetical protein